MYLVNLLTGERDPIANVPTVQATRQGGMLDVAVHQNPDDDSVTVYLCYSLLIGDKTVTAIDKAKFGGIDLTDRQTIFKANNQEISAIHYGCRLAIDQQYLYASLETAVTGMMHRTHHFMVALSLDYYMMAPQLPIIQNFKAGHLKYYPRVIATPRDWP